MLSRLLSRSIGTAEHEARLGEAASAIAGVGIIAVGTARVFALELDEPQRLLVLARTVMLGLLISAIGLLGSISAKVEARAPSLAPTDDRPAAASSVR